MIGKHNKSSEKKVRPVEVAPAIDGTRVEPSNPDAERALLASCLMDSTGDILTECASQKMRWEHFCVPAHQIIFKAMMDLYGQHKAGAPEPNEITLSSYLQESGQLDEVGGRDYLIKIINHVKMPANAQYWIEIVREKYCYRKLIETSLWIIEKCYHPSEHLDIYIDKMEKKVQEISNYRFPKDPEPMRESVIRAAALIEKIHNNKGYTQGISSGIPDLDKLTLGFKGGELIVLVAQPGLGKTDIALNFAQAAVLPRDRVAGKPTLFFSLELPAEQLAMQMLCACAHVDSQRIRDGFMSADDSHALGDAGLALSNAPMWIDDSIALNILELRTKARRICSCEQLGLIIVDYLQLIYGTNSTLPREQQVAEISRELKALSIELNVPVVVLAQPNMRESGSVEQEADMVLLLRKARDRIKGAGGEPNENHAFRRELIVAKNRNGPTGWVDIVFNKEERLP